MTESKIREILEKLYVYGIPDPKNHLEVKKKTIDQALSALRTELLKDVPEEASIMYVNCTSVGETPAAKGFNECRRLWKESIEKL